jgi:hypothetical protein
VKPLRRQASSAALDLDRREPADSIAAGRSPGPPHPPTVDSELLAQRDRLIERFAVMQSELGGLFYEMAIRDHVRMDVLIPKAAELQRVDSELGQVRRMIETGATGVGGNCSACGAVYAHGAVFCGQCAQPLAVP